MNVFTTDHPMTAGRPLFDDEERPVRVFFRQALVAALFVGPLFVCVTWFMLFGSDDSVDVPDPSWADPFFEVIAFFLTFPAVVLISMLDLSLPGFGLSSDAFLYLSVFLDGVFWAFVGTAVGHLLTRWFRKKQSLKMRQENYA